MAIHMMFLLPCPATDRPQVATVGSRDGPGHPPDYSLHYSSSRASATPRADLAARGEPQLGEDVLDVVLGGALGDEQPLGDLPVGEALGHQCGDLRLARAQRVVSAVVEPPRAGRGTGSA